MNSVSPAFYPDVRQLPTGQNYPIVAELTVNLLSLLPTRVNVSRTLTSGSGTVTDSVGGPEKTRLDLNLSGLTVPTGSGVKITFVIANHHPVKFMEDRTIGSDLYHYAVTAGNEATTDILHNPILFTDRKHVSVTCKRLPGFNAAVPFNLGVVFQDSDDAAFSLPIFLDPKIRNDG